MSRGTVMGLLSNHEAIVWAEFQSGKSTSEIAESYLAEDWSPSYTSRVLNRARKKISDALRGHADSHRLDVESLQDYKGLLIGFDYQANAQVYIVYTETLGVVVWYTHSDYAGKPCNECPKKEECRETLDVILDEYCIDLRADEGELPMTRQSTAIFHKLAAKEVPRYRRK